MNPEESKAVHWPRAGDPPLTQALLRSRPEDFLVAEQMPFALDGQGEHLWLKVRKRGLNTDQVAKLLARIAGIQRRDVGYAGMKDRHAITVQWFSLHLPGRGDPEWQGLPEGVEIVEAIRHTRKLKTGALAGNCFELVLRDCAGDGDELVTRIEAIRRGRNGENTARARAMFAGSIHIRDRHLRGIYLSAARSFLFNEVLAERIRTHTWQTPSDGEVCLLDGRNSFFAVETVDETIRRRLLEHDIHLSAPLWGAGELTTRGAAHELEAAMAVRHADLARGLEEAGLRQERRALRVIPKEMKVDALDEQTWRLEFCLPAGCYATAVLRELAAYRDLAGTMPEP
jgi:tRNA pseudouridine13 synthase